MLGNKLRLGITGMGYRGLRHLEMIASRMDVQVVAICDVNSGCMANVANFLPCMPKFYDAMQHGHVRMLRDEALDAVLIYTPWEFHLEQASQAMALGVAVGLEVSGSVSEAECWRYVEAFESSGTPIMFLENCCYRRDIMAVYNMVRKGLFGDLVHLRGGYRHDLRAILFGGAPAGEALWRAPHYFKRNGDIYPTHALGPLAKLAGINRGNRMLKVSAMASGSKGLSSFLPHGNDAAMGDVVTTQILCENGETILLTHDTTLPRPFGLELQVQGTKGIWQDFARGGLEKGYIYLENTSADEEKCWQHPEAILRPHDAEVWKRCQTAARFGRYDMDYIMLENFFQCVHTGNPFPIDVYDLAAWKCVTPLSEQSIREGSIAVEVPDFTRGKYKLLQPSPVL